MAANRLLTLLALAGALTGFLGRTAYHNFDHLVRTWDPPAIAVSLRWKGPNGQTEVDAYPSRGRPKLQSLDLDEELWRYSAPAMTGGTLSAIDATNFLDIWWHHARRDEAVAHVKKAAEARRPGWTVTVLVEECH